MRMPCLQLERHAHNQDAIHSSALPKVVTKGFKPASEPDALSMKAISLKLDSACLRPVLSAYVLVPNALLHYCYQASAHLWIMHGFQTWSRN